MIICADDFGLSDDVNDAILDLCERKKLSAVSCMVGAERFLPGSVAQLFRYKDQLDIGLHLCLADKGLPAFSTNHPAGELGALPRYETYLRRSLLGMVKASNVAALTAAQYSLFVRKCGATPDFIDGHLHAHQLPGARAGLIEFVHGLPATCRPYVRNTRIPLRETRKMGLPWRKATLIGVLGRTMLRRLRAAGLQTNDGFNGIYDFRDWQNYPAYLPCFLSCLPERNGILVTHPGKQEAWRRQEFESLSNFAFPPETPNRFGK